ncbi:undecaprenyl phosphate translocase family protein, partial [Oscillibacter sp. UBA6647]
YWGRIPALGLGCAVGFMGFARGISAALNVSAAVTTWAFIGLIVGTVPSLYREAGKEGHSRASWVSMGICAATIFGVLFYVGRVLSVQLEPNFWSFTLSGALFGLGIVIPGLAASSVLMALGL